MSEKKRFFLKYLVFVLIVVMITYLIEISLQPNKPYYLEEQNSTDILFFGTSFSYFTFDPAVFEKYGIRSYNLGRSRQTISWTYYQMRDALKTQNPQYIVLEPYGISYREKKSDEMDIGISNQSYDNMNFSLDSVLGVYNNVPVNRWVEFIFPIIRWHSEPSILHNLGLQPKADIYKGYVLASDYAEAVAPDDEILSDESIMELSESSLFYLEKMKELAAEHNFQLIIMRAPFPCNREMTEQMNALKVWADKNEIGVLDMTYCHEEIGIDYGRDTLDGMHLNDSGGAKASEYAVEWLKNNGYF